MLLATFALLLAEPNAAVAVATTASASATAPTEIAETGDEGSTDPQQERICRTRYGGSGVGLFAANQARKVCKTRAQWAANGSPAR